MEKTVAKEILSNMRYIEKDLWKKRMFLMGLSESDIYDKKGESHAARCENLQESFLRKDDVFYEDLKTIVEKDFGALNTDAGQDTIKGDDDAQFRNFDHMSRVVLKILDKLSNNGIYRLAKIFTQDSVIHIKTRPQMKRIIKERLKISQSKQCLADQGKIEGQVSKFVKNDENYRQNHVKHFDVSLTSHKDVVEKYLCAIKIMSMNTLIAMYNKLNGVRGYMPPVHRPKPSRSGKRLADRVKTLCDEKILQLKLSGIDKLSEPLAKAMDIVRLSSKLSPGYNDLPQVKFVHVTPELEALQNEIFKAMSQRIKPEDKNKLQQLLYPKYKMGDILSRRAIKNMLIEFLYECSDMDTIPDNLVEALSIINNTPSNTRTFSSKDRIQDELECVLNVGAHIKQILWDHVADNNLDQDFSDAYMEELTESDDGDFLDDDDDDDYDSDDELKLFTNTLHEVQVRLNFIDCNEEVESTGDAADQEYYCSQDDVKNTNKYSSSSFGTARAFDDNDDVNLNTKASSSEMLISTVSGTSPLVPNIPEQCGNVKEMDRNRYVALQEVSDRASLAAYQLIEHMMDQFGKTEALPTCSRSKKSAHSMGKDASRLVIIRAAREVMPSFPMSELEKVYKFMSL